MASLSKTTQHFRRCFGLSTIFKVSRCKSFQTKSRLQGKTTNNRPTITLFTKDDCSLCDVAKEKLEQYKDMCNMEFVYIDKEENNKWFEEYKYDIPVVHLNGKFLMKHKVFKDALDEAIRNAVNSSNPEKISTASHKKQKRDEGHLNFYSGSYLNRCAHIRKNEKVLEGKMSEKGSKYVVFKTLMPLLIGKKNSKGKELRTLSFKELSNVLSPAEIAENCIYLGNESDQVDWFAINLSKDVNDSALDRLEGDAEFMNAFNGMMRLDEMQSSIASQARGILAWHDSHKFCPQCGTKSVPVEGGYRRRCKNESCKTNKVDSHHTCYPRIDPVTMALVLSPDHNKILLGRKSMYPSGFFTCLAGYVEPGESFETSVKREVLEECGLPVYDIRYLLSQSWPFPSSLMFGCIAIAEHMNVEMDREELDEVSWFDKDEATQLISIERHRQFIAGEAVTVAPWRYALAHHLIKRWIIGEY